MAKPKRRIGTSCTKEQLLDRMENTRKMLKDIFKANCGHPNEEVRNIVSEVIEALGALDGLPEHDV